MRIARGANAADRAGIMEEAKSQAVQFGAQVIPVLPSGKYANEMATPTPAAPEAPARLHQEARAAARLKHPSIVVVFDYGEDRVVPTPAGGGDDRAYVDAHTEGFEAYAAHVARFTKERAAEATGISADRIEELARVIFEGKRVSFWWTMGVNQSHEGVRTAQAIIWLEVHSVSRSSKSTSSDANVPTQSAHSPAGPHASPGGHSCSPSQPPSVQRL